MDDLDSLLQDLERATTNLKNNPGNLGAWKLNKPNDPTLTSAYSTAKVAKHYSPQYYVNDEPLYQNETLHRSQSIGSSTTHDYAAINGNGTSSPQPSTPSTMQYQVNGISNGHMANGDLNQQQQRMQPHRSDSFQVNDLIKDLEYNLHSTDSPYAHVNKPVKSVTINANGMQTSSVRPSPPRSAQIQPVSEYNRNLVSIQPQHARMDSNAVLQVPLPHVTSNATRELDDLMASLSDFKLNQMKNGQTPSTKNANYVPIGKIKVPSKNPQLEPLRPADKLHLAGDLDSMIGNLESDLNRHGVNTTTKGTCEKCKRAIVGQVVTAMGKTWHPEHFTCLQCGTELGDSTFFERDGLAFCERDYHKLYSPQCAYCNKPILDRCITALEKTWHPEHFSCAHCGKNFGDDGYHEKAGNAYCREDFYNLFAPKCVGCSNPIEDNYVTAMGGQWHSECFVCRDCNTPFNNGSFFDFEGRPYCEPHYHDKRGTLCATCRKPIEGRCITAMSQKYHPEHFTCSFCLKQLNKGTFKKHSEKPYCHSCFDKLFA